MPILSGMVHSLKNLFLSVNSIYVLLYLPFSVVVYSPYWYLINTKQYSPSRHGVVKEAIQNITDYFMHFGKLHSHIWSSKEILHLQEIRGIYDALFVMLCIALVICLVFVRKSTLQAVTSIRALYCYGLFIAITTTLIVTSFKPIWSFLHKVSFNNNYYIYTKHDMSAVLFPHAFFQNSIMLIFFSFILCLLLIRLVLRFIDKR